MPSRGGQLAHFSASSNRLLFQFMPSRGGQHQLTEDPQDVSQFQFMPSRGGQHQKAELFVLPQGFNSCPRAEGNSELKVWPSECDVSIHALARRATASSVPRISLIPLVSIHALARRATPKKFKRAFIKIVFQFMPSRGGQLQAESIPVVVLGFNSCPRAEGNKRSPDSARQLGSFNSCPRAEGNGKCQEE